MKNAVKRKKIENVSLFFYTKIIEKQKKEQKNFKQKNQEKKVENSNDKRRVDRNNSSLSGNSQTIFYTKQFSSSLLLDRNSRNMFMFFISIQNKHKF